MSKNIDQVFIANPITTNAGTDLMYFGQSPYGAGNDAAMLYSNFAAQVALLGVTPQQVQQNAFNSGNDIGARNAYAVTLSPAPASLTDGMVIYLLNVISNNTAASTLNVNGLGAINIQTASYGNLNGGEIENNGEASIFYYSAANNVFYLINPSNGLLPQDQQFSAYLALTDGGSANVYSAGANPTVTSYTQFGGFYTVLLKVANTNTGASTFNVDGVGAANITLPNGSPLSAGNMVAGMIAILVYDGTNFELMNAVVPTSSFWVDDVSTTVAMTANTGYTSDAGVLLVTFTLPAVAAIGDFVEINGKGSGLWKVAQAVAGQQIIFGNQATTVGVGGSIASTLQYDCIRLRCLTANVLWTVVSAVGNLTVT